MAVIAEIERELFINQTTVKTHVTRVLESSSISAIVSKRSRSPT
jgi:DNA-binding NarL/FixJ family response regulator